MGWQGLGWVIELGGQRGAHAQYPPARLWVLAMQECGPYINEIRLYTVSRVDACGDLLRIYEFSLRAEVPIGLSLRPPAASKRIFVMSVYHPFERGAATG